MAAPGRQVATPIAPYAITLVSFISRLLSQLVATRMHAGKVVPHEQSHDPVAT
jgi:hypothetical protein